MTLQRICAWCNSNLGPTADGQATAISHGICDSCREYFFGEGDGGVPLEEFLERLEAPVQVVDAGNRVLFANRSARDLVGKDLGEVRGYRGGEVMECAYSRLPEGCGRTVHCDGCAIRKTVRATHADGLSRRGVEAFQELSGPDGVQSTRIVISTEKSGDVVLLRIDSLSPALRQGAG